MTSIQIIELHGRPVAGVADVDATIAGADRRRVQAKALCAIEIAAATRRGPYTDFDAERYADAAQTLRCGAGPARAIARRTQESRDGRHRG